MAADCNPQHLRKAYQSENDFDQSESYANRSL